MALPQKVHYYTPEEYLAFECAAKTKHEYLDGQIYAMAGGSPQHNQICFNTNVAVGVQIRGTDCIGYISDQKIRTDPMDLFFYPDLTIVCGKLVFHDKHKTSFSIPNSSSRFFRPALKIMTEAGNSPATRT